MLIYHPAYDAYHCIFRALLLTDKMHNLEISKLRILDFFLCFPSEVQKVRFPKTLNKAKRMAQEMVNEYHGPVSMEQAFRDMQHIQYAAFRALAASEIFDGAEFERGIVKRTSVNLPEELTLKINDAVREGVKVVELVVEILGSIPLQGINGLKHRTGLMEYRYDLA